MANDPPLRKGQILEGRYEVGDLLGGGAMGLVFEARHLLLDKIVAVKVLRPALVADDDVRLRFEAEARAAASVGHPNIVAVTDMGRTETGATWFAMERLLGESLGQRLTRQGRLDPNEAVRIAADVLGGLEAAHARGLVHRDVKPDNVFLAIVPGGQESARLLDFGVAKALTSGRAAATQAGTAIGTPEYMAPEQAQGQSDVDGRTDVYAVGTMLYRMLSGRNAFEGDTALAVMTAILLSPPPPLASLRPDLPPALVAVIGQAMSREREARPASARALRDLLLAALPAARGPGGTAVLHPPPAAGFALPPGPSAAVTSPVGPTLGMSAAGVVIDDPTGVGTRAAGPPAIGLGEGPVLLEAIERGGWNPGTAPPALDRASPSGAARESTPVPPGIGDAPLVLVVPTSPPKAATMAPAASPRRPGPARLIAGVLLLACVAGGTWWAVAGRGRASGTDRAVLVEIDVTPRSATLHLDGMPMPSNPLRIRADGTPHIVAASAPGFEPGRATFVSDRNQTVRLPLRRR